MIQKRTAIYLEEQQDLRDIQAIIKEPTMLRQLGLEQDEYDES